MGIKDILQIGSTLKAFRKAANLTQQEMADKLGLKLSTYSNYENNNRMPSRETVDSIAEILDIEPRQLFDFVSVSEVNEIESFVRFLESIGYEIHIEPNPSAWHEECIYEDGSTIGKSQIADDNNVSITIKQGKFATVCNGEEFQKLQDSISKAIEFELFKLKK